MNYFIIFTFLLASGINAVAQLLLKKGSLLIGPTLAGEGGGSLIAKLFKVLLNPFIASAIILLVMGMFIWIKILSRVELSRAYPVNIALTIIFTSAASIFLFQESASWMKFAGIILVIAGIWALLAG